MDELFSTLGGLPLHPLVVHFAVVLIPLGAVGLIVVALWERFRAAYLPVVMGVLGVGSFFAFVSTQSGEQLSASEGYPQEHAALGDVLFPASVGLVALAVTLFLVTRANRSSTHVRIAVVAAIVGAVAVGALTFFVGHSGASATWGEYADDEQPVAVSTATPTPSVTPAPSETSAEEDESQGGSGGESSSGSNSSGGSSSSGGNNDESTDNSSEGITMAEVRTHNSASDCWIVVDNAVIDLTSFISRHPGGAGVLTALCGTDATSAFQSKHANDRMPAAELQRLTIGTLAR